MAYKVGKFPFSASGKAVAVNHPEGFVKLIVGEKYGEILGAHIIGHDTLELIAEFGLGMKLEATDEIHATIHAATLGEAMGEAAAAYTERQFTFNLIRDISETFLSLPQTEKPAF